MTISELHTICQENGLALSASQLALLEQYAELLLDWNSKINLISRKDSANILSRHILHSLTLAMPEIAGYGFSGKSVMDIGTGGGLPGIPLKIAAPSALVTLLDSTQKKIMVCNDVITKLGLTGIRALCGRAEELAVQHDQTKAYDVIVSRAVAPLDDLLKWTRRMIKPSGLFFSLKGGDLSEEVSRSNKLPYVRQISEVTLSLHGYDELATESKKLVRVDMNT